MLVRLHPKRLDGRPFARVEHSDLHACAIGIVCHFAAEGIDLPYEVTFARATNGRITGHECNLGQVEREEGSAAAHSCGGQGGFAAGMAGPDDDHIKLLGGVQLRSPKRRYVYCSFAMLLLGSQ